MFRRDTTGFHCCHVVTNSIYQVGFGSPDVSINMSDIMPKELVMKGSFRYGVSSTQILIIWC